MGVDLKFVSDVLKVNLQTIEKMEKYPAGCLFIKSNKRDL